MKKRVKLLTTIASLCLAVALMAFGVYAASNITVKASGTIQFGSTTIAGEWTQVVVSVQNGTVGGEASKTYTVTNNADVTIDNVVVTDIDEACVITVTATFKNTSTSKAVLTSTGTVEESQVGYTLAKDNSATGEAAANAEGTTENYATGTVTATYTITVSDKTQSVSGIDYSATFAANEE